MKRLHSIGAMRSLHIGVAVALLAGLLLLVWQMLPRPFEGDLSVIGQGRPALVLVYDPNLVVSGDQASELDDARAALTPHMHLLVARVGYPEAASIIKRHAASAGTLLLFDGEGGLQQQLSPVVPAAELRALAD